MCVFALADLSRPIGALDEKRLKYFQDRFKELKAVYEPPQPASVSCDSQQAHETHTHTHTDTHTDTHTSDFTGPGRVVSPALSLRHPLQHPGVNSLTANEGARTILLANSRPPVRVGMCCSTSCDTRPRTCCVCKTDDSTRQTDSSTGEWAPGGAMCVICWEKKKEKRTKVSELCC